jgi:hypothetical protein
MFVAGRRFELIILCLICLLMYYFIERAKRGTVPVIRPIPAIEALDEAVGRAVELGRPVHFSTGMSGLDNAFAPQTIAGLSIMKEVAKLCGEYEVPMRYTATRSYMIPIAEDIIKSSYLTCGKPEMYSPDSVVYVGESQPAFQASVVSYLTEERPATNLMFGGITAEAIQTLGAGAVAGSMQFAGTARMFYFSFILCLCDYSLIGEELFAAAAAVSGEGTQLGVIRGQDVSKFIVIALLVLGIILSTMGNGLFTEILGW